MMLAFMLFVIHTIWVATLLTKMERSEDYVIPYNEDKYEFLIFVFLGIPLFLIVGISELIRYEELECNKMCLIIPEFIKHCRMPLIEGPRIWAESCLSIEEWKEYYKKYPTVSKFKTPPEMFECEFKWKYGMGKSMSAEDIKRYNSNMDALLAVIARPPTNIVLDEIKV